jgi:hypothetical protein
MSRAVEGSKRLWRRRLSLPGVRDASFNELSSQVEKEDEMIRMEVLILLDTISRSMSF